MNKAKSLPFPFPAQVYAKFRIERVGNEYLVVGHNQGRNIPHADAEGVRSLLYQEVDRIIDRALEQQSIEVSITLSYNTSS